MISLADLIKEKVSLENKLKEIRENYDGEVDNEDTWGGHDGPWMMQIENDIEIIKQNIEEIGREIKNRAGNKKDKVK